jgi:hypothetical protein
MIETYITELKTARESINDLCENLASGFMADTLEHNLVKTAKLFELLTRINTLKNTIDAIHELNLIKLKALK